MNEASWAAGFAMDRMRTADAASQPPVQVPAAPVILFALLGSLAIGGAERIVLDWAARNHSRCRVRLFVIHRHGAEWPLPSDIEVVRPVSGQPVDEALRAFASQAVIAWREAFGGGLPVVLCHMSRQEHRGALEAGGALAVPVLHNAREGWREPFEALRDDRRLIAVSQSCVDDLGALGRRSGVSLIRHIPSLREPGEGAVGPGMRAALCRTLGLPEPGAVRLIAMVGGVKAQKNYLRALEILRELAADSPATCLVIFGGPVGHDGRRRWDELCAEVRRLRLQDRVRLPGFVAEASRWLPAFDLMLNTSDFEGLSIATLEALQARVPVVASLVGGQGELRSPGLTLVQADAPAAQWAGAIRRAAAGSRPARPAWAGFPSHRLWTLEHLAAGVRDGETRRHVLFVTANLNAGGAQRSLVNLASHFAREAAAGFSFEVAVTGDSSSDWFYRSLTAAGVQVSRTAAGRDCFDHAEGLAQRLASSRAGIVCFWNVDPKIKLLTAKTAPRRVHLIDVSPGGYAFEEMQATGDFQQLIGFDEAQYHARLSHLVFKYDGAAPAGLACPTSVVRNGVAPAQSRVGSSPAPRVIVNGRIAPSKFVLEIAGAMARLWQRRPEVELHIIGTAEPRHEAYAHQVIAALDHHVAAGRRVRLHGAQYELAQVATGGDIAVVLGHHQGCPNAALEASALGMAVVANDSGGTGEVVRHEQTGLLIQGHASAMLAQALERLLTNPDERWQFGMAARAHVLRHFSMEAMASGYLGIFQQLVCRETTCV